MKKSKTAFFIFTALAALLLINDHLCGQSSKPRLIIVLPGATSGLDPTDLVKNPDTDPFLHEVHIYSTSSGFNPAEIQGVNLYKTEEVIFKVFVHYPSEMEGITPNQEIAQESYIENAEKLIETAAEAVTNIIEDFLHKNSQGHITIVAAGMSGEIILKVLAKNSPTFDNVIFFYPTLGMVNNAKMVNVLKEKGYLQEKVKVIVYANDPTILQLQEQKRENEGVFSFLVIEAVEK